MGILYIENRVIAYFFVARVKSKSSWLSMERITKKKRAASAANFFDQLIQVTV
jgi:hypothetical protein